jgi:hypothetical protein
MRGPWYITPSAVRDYLRIRGWSEPDFERGHADLLKIAEEIAASGKQPAMLDNGFLRYRTGRAHGRMGLVVSPVPRVEGDLPQLVAVTRSAH